MTNTTTEQTATPPSRLAGIDSRLSESKQDIEAEFLALTERRTQLVDELAELDLRFTRTVSSAFRAGIDRSRIAELAGETRDKTGARLRDAGK